jgi:hypothetical protein
LTDLRVVSAQRWLDEILGPRGSPVDPNEHGAASPAHMTSDRRRVANWIT